MCISDLASDDIPLQRVLIRLPFSPSAASSARDFQGDPELLDVRSVFFPRAECVLLLRFLGLIDFPFVCEYIATCLPCASKVR